MTQSSIEDGVEDLIANHRKRESEIVEAIGMIRSPEETAIARQWVRRSCDYMSDQAARIAVLDKRIEELTDLMDNIAVVAWPHKKGHDEAYELALSKWAKDRKARAALSTQEDG